MSKRNAGAVVLSIHTQTNQTERGWRQLRGCVSCIFLLTTFAAAAMADEAPVNLGSAGDFAVLASSTVTNVNSVGTVITGELGVSPGTGVSGFPPGIMAGASSIHAGDVAAAQAQADLTTAYNDAAGRVTAPIAVAGNLGGMTLYPGLYKSTSSLAISSGDLTLDAQGDPNAVFIFQMASTLTTTSGRQVILIGDANAYNIFWQVGSSATFGSTSVMKGTILAHVSISFNTGATLDGRALASTGGVTLDANVITIPVAPPPAATATPTATPSATYTPVPDDTATVTPTPMSTATATQTSTTATYTPTQTVAAEDTATPTVAQTVPSTATPTSTGAPAATATPTYTPVPGDSATITPTPTSAATVIATPTDTPAPNTILISVDPEEVTIEPGASHTFQVTASFNGEGRIELLDDTLLGDFDNELQLAGNLTADYIYTANDASGVVTVTLTAKVGEITAFTSIEITVGEPPVPITAERGIAIGTGQGVSPSNFQLYVSPSGLFDANFPNSTTISSNPACIAVAAADVLGNGWDEVITAKGGDNGAITIFDSSTRTIVAPGILPFAIGAANAFDNNPTGETRVAAGNVIGNASAEIICVQGANAQSRFRVLQVVNGVVINDPLNSFRPLELGNPANGINAACGDVDGDGFDEIVCTQAGPVTTIGQGGAFDFVSFLQAVNVTDAGAIESSIPGSSIQRSRIQATFGLTTNPSGGVRVAVGDIDADGRDEIVVVSASTSGTTGGNHLMVLESNLTNDNFTSSTSPFEVALSLQLFSTASNPSGNIYLGIADTDGVAGEEIITGRGENIANQVLVYKYNPAPDGGHSSVSLLDMWTVSDANPAGGTHVAGGLFGRRGSN